VKLDPSARALSAPAPERPGLRPGRWLLLARVCWVAAALLCVGLFAAGVPLQFAQLQSIRAQATCAAGHGLPDSAQCLATDGVSADSYAALSVGLLVVAMLVWSAVGLLIFLHASERWIAWFVSLFLVMSGVTISPIVVDALASAHPGVALLVQLVKESALIGLFLFFCLFPDGQFVPRWTRWVVLIYPLLTTASGLVPGSRIDIATWSPLLNWLVLALSFGVIGFAQVYRYRYHSGVQQRQQTKWVMFGASVALLGLVSLVLLSEVLLPGLDQPGSLSRLAIEGSFTVLMLLIPITIGVAILRFRLYDIDLIMQRALVYGALTLCVVGMYVFVVGYLGALFRVEGNLAISLVATGIVAVLFQPVRMRLQRGVSRLLYGERDEPYTVIARLGQRLDATFAPDAVLPAVVETVAQALKLPYVAIALQYSDGAQVVAETGDPQPVQLRLPLSSQGETVGYMLLAARIPGEPFTPADHALLAVLANQAGVAAHAVRLTSALEHSTSALQHARERLVTTREEERRRMRRDLHDGIGPTLASVVQRLDLARGLIAHEPSAVEPLLAELKGQVKDTIAEIRRLVYALRPPVLDELGLVSALREHAAQLQQGSSIAITLQTPESLPPLSAAVEVAAYRIVLEALTNVLRHAQARSCTLRLEVSAAGEQMALRVAITDDGVGVAPEHQAGVGLASMRERAAELGGTWTISSAPGGGTQVVALLPLAQG
jgi:signal transduction histidine kinase